MDTKELMQKVRIQLENGTEETLLDLIVLLVERVAKLDGEMAGMLENHKMLIKVVTLLSVSSKLNTETIRKHGEVLNMLQQYDGRVS